MTESVNSILITYLTALVKVAERISVVPIWSLKWMQESYFKASVHKETIAFMPYASCSTTFNLESTLGYRSI